MRWPGWSSERKDVSETSSPPPPPSPPPPKPVSWNESLNKMDWQHFKEPSNWIPSLLVTATALGLLRFYRSYLRRIPGTDHIKPTFFRRRSLFGRVTSVGDGDNFHMFHTPGGRLAGWGWLRRVPTERKELKGRTIPIRMAGVDAPEGAHFGRPAQPYASEALDFLTSYILGRRVRAYIYKRDQYDRVVGTVWVRRWLFFRRDVGLEMLKRGLATTYEAKSGAEFGGLEQKYRAAEARAKARRKGMWGTQRRGEVFESPREYKTRIATAEKTSSKEGQ